MVTTILQNPQYTGRQVWNRQRTDRDLVDPGDVALRREDDANPSGEHTCL
jgi:hypothetical protein